MRNVLLAAWVAVAMSSVGGHAEEISFDDLVFEQTVSPNQLIEVKTKCAATGEVLAVSREVDPCEPDPYLQICAEADKQGNHEKHSLRVQRGLNFKDSVTSANGDLTIPPEVRKKAQLAVNEAVDRFLEMLKRSRTLQTDYETLKSVIRTCASQLAVLPDDGHQAVMKSKLDATGVLGIQKLAPGTKVNPTALAHSTGCSLKLSARAWLECAEGTPVCYWTLFHELGHKLEACPYLLQSAGSSDVRGPTQAAIESYGLVHQPGLASLLEGIDMNQASSARIASAVMEATQPLQALSSPRMGLRNACPKDQLAASIQERCNIGTAGQFPSQWNEAEADFWGASALSVWLEARKADHKSRKRAFKEIAAFFCEDSSRNENEFPEGPGSLFASGEACETQTAKGVAPIGEGWSKHLPYPRRFNRNLLRNADLRNALGCKLSADVPMAASPLGKVESILIK